MGHTGIVQNQISAAMGFVDLIGQGKHGVAIRDINNMRLAASTGFDNLLMYGFQHV